MTNWNTYWYMTADWLLTEFLLADCWLSNWDRLLTDCLKSAWKGWLNTLNNSDDYDLQMENVDGVSVDCLDSLDTGL